LEQVLEITSKSKHFIFARAKKIKALQAKLHLIKCICVVKASVTSLLRKLTDAACSRKNWVVKITATSLSETTL
jgi:hypothetical protein